MDTKFSLIPDKPIKADKQDELYFGYREIAETLALIVKKCPTPFTVGLFGKWGTGKSTVLNQLKNFTDKDSVFVIFDIWKYESDALRRSFILDIALQLRKKHFITYSYIEKIKQRLYMNINKPKEFFNFSWRGFFLGAIIFTFVFLLQISLVDKPSGIILASSLMAGFIAAFPEIVKKNISIDKISIGKDKLNSPEEFEAEFKRLLLRLSGKKLIIGIDNLDRVSSNSTVELLGTIKTFLTSDQNIEDVVYIIVCDDDAIKEHLKTVYQKRTESEFEPEEFLRKFFNIILRIPKFLNLEMDAYTKLLLKQTEIPAFRNNLDLELILNHTFRDNPREIKQFINNIISYYLFAKKREGSGDIDTKFIDKNLPFIAKLLIIRQKFSVVYKFIEHKTLREGATWSDIISDRPHLESLLKNSDRQSFSDFLEGTDWIKPTSENISVFLTLKRSVEEKDLPGWDQLVNAAINKQIDPATNIIRKFRI